MAYATQQDLEDAAGGAARFLELTDIDDDGAVDAAPVARAQAAAESWIDSFLSSRYAPLPLAAPTPELRAIAAEETLFRLRQKKPGGASQNELEAHKDRVTQLQAYRSGGLRPDLPGVLRSDAGRARIVTSEDAGAIVSRESLKGMW